MTRSEIIKRYGGGEHIDPNNPQHAAQAFQDIQFLLKGAEAMQTTLFTYVSGYEYGRLLADAVAKGGIAEAKVTELARAFLANHAVLVTRGHAKLYQAAFEHALNSVAIGALSGDSKALATLEKMSDALGASGPTVEEKSFFDQLKERFS